MTRSRRSCLSVPGSSTKMLAKAQALPADEVFMDLEDSVAPDAKESARRNVIDALRDGSWSGKTVVVRVNDVRSRWCYRDVVQIVERAGENIDAVMVPKVECAADVSYVDYLLHQIESFTGLRRRIGLELQIESAKGITNIDEIAAASTRAETLIFGPADMSASLGLPTLAVGLPMEDYPGDHWHYVMSRMVVGARNAGLQVIDGPYGLIHDLIGFRMASLKARALGFDGKWALHPGQIGILNDVFVPSEDQFAKAIAILRAYEQASSREHQGAVMFGEEMIDEASRKMANGVAARGVAAGYEVAY